MKKLMTKLLLSAAILATGGCGDDSSTGPKTSTQVDLTLSMTDMTPHVGQFLDIRLVSAGDSLQARAIIESLASAAKTVTIPKAFTTGSYHIDFFADFNNNGAYDAPNVDHAWRVTVPADGMVSFAHNVSFTDISSPALTLIGGPFQLDMTGFVPHVGQVMEFRVIDSATGSAVGVYHVSSLSGAAATVRIEGIIKDGVTYQIDFFADLSGNGTYDAPPTDHAWRVFDVGTAGGLTVTFPHDIVFTDVMF